MPEGDTIFLAAETLRRALVGQTVTRFRSVFPALTRVDDDRPIAGRTIEAIEAHGKHLLITFTGGLTLRTHMRMNGSWHVYPPGARWRRPARDMRIVVETARATAVAFTVPVAEFLTESQLARSSELRALGPDLLADAFDADEARRRIRGRGDDPIADVLLSQRVVAGIGNVFKSEVLFMARVHPFAPASAVSDTQIDDLLGIARKVMRASVRLGMRTTRSSLDPRERLWVRTRRQAVPALRHGHLRQENRRRRARDVLVPAVSAGATIACVRAPVAVVAFTVAAQTINPSPRAIIRLTRPLQPAEVTQVLDAARQAIAGRGARLSYVTGGPGIDIIMGTDGRPTWVRTTGTAEARSSAAGSVNGVPFTDSKSEQYDVVNIVHYTRTPGRACDGRALDAELLIDYEHKTPPDTWTVKTRTVGPLEPLSPIFNALSGSTALKSAGFRDFDGGRRARAFTARFALPAGAVPADPDAAAAMRQVLWIDVESLLPLRWSLALPPNPDIPPGFDYGLSFTYDRTIAIDAPDGVTVPDCVR
jgi:endonuclease-8